MICAAVIFFIGVSAISSGVRGEPRTNTKPYGALEVALGAGFMFLSLIDVALILFLVGRVS